MYRNDIDVIRAVQLDRIRRDVTARVRREVAPRDSTMRAARRLIGRSIVRIGARIAAEPLGEHSLDLAGSR